MKGKFKTKFVQMMSASLLIASLLGSTMTIHAEEGVYASELTGLPISAQLKEQRPIAVMVDNEVYALDHYGLTQADIVYEIMNSTANDEVTRFMALVKDWGNITRFGSIRSPA